MANEKPEKRFQQGNCSASVFRNKTEKDGKTLEISSVCLQKTYTDKEDKWQHTNSFGINDLPKISLAAQKAYDYLTTKEKDNQG